ncbi:hypothetical protein ACFLZJ_02110 [Nanoarchaeota archaeon]
MKKGLSILALSLVIFFTNLVSAYFSFGGGFSLSNLLYNINPNSMTLWVMFIVVFALIYFILTRVLKNRDGEPNVMVSAIIAGAIALFTIYGINRSSFNVTSMFYTIGISQDILSWFIPLILLILAIFILIKWKFSGLLMVLGGLLAGISLFTDAVYAENANSAAVIGLAMFFIGLWLWRRRRRRMMGYGGSGYYPLKRAGRAALGGARRVGGAAWRHKGAPRRGVQRLGRRYNPVGRLARREGKIATAQAKAERKAQAKATEDAARQRIKHMKEHPENY